jgi:hypothetical protein
MVDQPVPNVTEGDVKRIALRDFGDAQVALVLSILDEFGKQDWNRPDPRVRLAILKLANGNLDRLLDESRTAIQDYRAVLSEAEYPRYSRKIGLGDDPESVQRAVIDDDWRQYREWLENLLRPTRFACRPRRLANVRHTIEASLY